MMNPLIVVNLKTYQQGKEVLKLCRKIEKVSKDIVVGVQVGDVYEVAHKTSLKVYCQHVDAVEPGRNTGFVAVEGVKSDGAVGVFLNHSEHPLTWDVLKKTVLRCKEVGLKTLVFAGSLKDAKRIEKLGVDYVCIEPAELVGGEVSVSTARPELIAEIGKKLKGKFLVGAGIHNHEDIEVAMKFGASGVALSSAVTTAKNPEKVLRKLLEK
ncbi:triose-phosphate isomerase [Candidatus Pacearchaeota archaeon]|nr:triose-phosphate isomerase [Candidatus Pacearchaeota archaeon]